MTKPYDDLECQAREARARGLNRLLNEQVARASALPGYAETLGPVAAEWSGDLTVLPVLRKSDHPTIPHAPSSL